MPKVFISYSHDSEPHRQRVLALANRLRTEGVDCSLDRYESLPPEGWPQWMSRHIRESDYVLVVCTDAYARRVRGEEAPGLGLGATWEGQLITQAIYEAGGRNSRFIPILFSEADGRYVPDFLLPATRFTVSNQPGYEGLYRLLTEQPAILRPALGAVRLMPPADVATESPDAGSLADEAAPFVERSGPTIAWRLPRGFILLEDLEQEPDPSWATIASYYDYRGEWVASTHFHESYQWRERSDGMERQFVKLGIPQGDWFLAYAPVELMMEIRHQRATVAHSGQIEGRSLDQTLATVHAPGPVPLPRMPHRYRGIAASGRFRDLAIEADELWRRSIGPPEPADLWLPGLDENIRRLRREVRIDIQRLFSAGHPAARSLEEIIETYQPGAATRVSWLREFGSAIREAASCIEGQTT